MFVSAIKNSTHTQHTQHTTQNECLFFSLFSSSLSPVEIPKEE